MLGQPKAQDMGLSGNWTDRSKPLLPPLRGRDKASSPRFIPLGPSLLLLWWVVGTSLPSAGVSSPMGRWSQLSCCNVYWGTGPTTPGLVRDRAGSAGPSGFNTYSSYDPMDISRDPGCGTATDPEALSSCPGPDDTLALASTWPSDNNMASGYSLDPGIHVGEQLF